MIDLADAVAAVLAHHRETGRFGMLLDRMTDIAQGGARAHRLDTAHHRFVRGVDQPLGQHRRRASDIHTAGVAVPTVLDHGDVEVDDVAVLEHLPFVRDAMTDHMVDRGAQGLRKAVVADVGWNRLLHVDDVLVGEPVELLGGDTGLDVFLQHRQHFSRQLAGNTHAFEVFGGFQGNGHDFA